MTLARTSVEGSDEVSCTQDPPIGCSCALLTGGGALGTAGLALQLQVRHAVPALGNPPLHDAKHPIAFRGLVDRTQPNPGLLQQLAEGAESFGGARCGGA